MLYAKIYRYDHEFLQELVAYRCEEGYIAEWQKKVEKQGRG